MAKLKYLSASSSVHDFLGSLQSEFEHDRTKTVGASEIAKCARMIGYKKAGIEPDEETDLSGFGARGNVMEDHMLAPFADFMVSKLGGTMHFHGQENQMTLEAPKLGLSATPDGAATGLPKTALSKVNGPKYSVPKFSGSMLVEFKSFDPRKNTGKFPEHPHVGQCNYGTGMLRTSWDALEIDAPAPDAAYLLYVNASDYSDVREYAFKFNSKMFTSQKARAKAIINAAREGKVENLRPEGKITGECRLCDYKQRCTGYTNMVPPEIAKLRAKGQEELTRLLTEHRGVKTKYEDAEVAKKALEAQIREALMAAKTKWADVEGIGKVNWTRSAGRSSFDRKKAEAALTTKGYKVEDFIKQGNPSETLKIEYITA